MIVPRKRASAIRKSQSQHTQLGGARDACQAQEKRKWQMEAAAEVPLSAKALIRAIGQMCYRTCLLILGQTAFWEFKVLHDKVQKMRKKILKIMSPFILGVG